MSGTRRFTSRWCLAAQAASNEEYASSPLLKIFPAEPVWTLSEGTSKTCFRGDGQGDSPRWLAAKDTERQIELDTERERDNGRSLVESKSSSIFDFMGFKLMSLETNPEAEGAKELRVLKK